MYARGWLYNSLLSQQGSSLGKVSSISPKFMYSASCFNTLYSELKMLIGLLGGNYTY
jgi:hypothetical protein